jgi:hypothetical protein
VSCKSPVFPHFTCQYASRHNSSEKHGVSNSPTFSHTRIFSLIPFSLSPLLASGFHPV